MEEEDAEGKKRIGEFVSRHGGRFGGIGGWWWFVKR
jgi:hypothetical protein